MQNIVLVEESGNSPQRTEVEQTDSSSDNCDSNFNNCNNNVPEMSSVQTGSEATSQRTDAPQYTELTPALPEQNILQPEQAVVHPDSVLTHPEQQSGAHSEIVQCPPYMGLTSAVTPPHLDSYGPSETHSGPHSGSTLLQQQRIPYDPYQQQIHDDYRTTSARHGSDTIHNQHSEASDQHQSSFYSAPPSGSSSSDVSLDHGGGSGACVYLCNRNLWVRFHAHVTEMIITKQGRYVWYLFFSRKI